MQRDPRFDGLFEQLGRNPPQPAGLLQRVGAIVATVALVLLSLFFGVMLFAVVVSVGLLAWGYFWWKTRELRKVMREQAQAAQAAQGSRPPGAGVVIEGEVIREVREDADPRPGDR